ncbi:MAG: tail protein X, partial [Shewanella sp.]|nr:tail protein X [Shewanella sp.]
MLDAICHRYYDGRPKAVEAVLAANPGLARQGPVMPDGLLIELPELP